MNTSPPIARDAVYAKLRRISVKPRMGEAVSAPYLTADDALLLLSILDNEARDLPELHFTVTAPTGTPLAAVLSCVHNLPDSQTEPYDVIVRRRARQASSEAQS